MMERCDRCGAYLEDGGLLCEKCRKDMKHRINHRKQMNENRMQEAEVNYEAVRN